MALRIPPDPGRLCGSFSSPSPSQKETEGLPTKNTPAVLLLIWEAPQDPEDSTAILVCPTCDDVSANFYLLADKTSCWRILNLMLPVCG